nr:hypothetical protein Itr_chr01CG06060 [Ipomoea trifida]
MRMNGPEPYDGSGARSGALPLCLRRRSSSDDVKDGQHRAAAWMVGGECSGSGVPRRCGPARRCSPFVEVEGSGVPWRRAWRCAVIGATSGSGSGRGDRLPLLCAVCEQGTGDLFADVSSITSVAAFPQ